MSVVISMFALVKIDVEGAEVSILRGALETLAERPPGALYIEVYEEFFDEVQGLLSAYYRSAYRLCCNRTGQCRLYRAHAGPVGPELRDLFSRPPTYLYTNADVGAFAEDWISPGPLA
jgi:hypothetical protein